jgi:hypothetical protein
MKCIIYSKALSNFAPIQSTSKTLDCARTMHKLKRASSGSKLERLADRPATYRSVARRHFIRSTVRGPKDRAPTYYPHFDAPLYYYSFTGACIARAYKSLPKGEQSRFDPMIAASTQQSCIPRTTFAGCSSLFQVYWYLRIHDSQRIRIGKATSRAASGWNTMESVRHGLPTACPRTSTFSSQNACRPLAKTPKRTTGNDDFSGSARRSLPFTDNPASRPR